MKIARNKKKLTRGTNGSISSRTLWFTLSIDLINLSLCRRRGIYSRRRRYQRISIIVSRGGALYQPLRYNPAPVMRAGRHSVKRRRGADRS